MYHIGVIVWWELGNCWWVRHNNGWYLMCVSMVTTGSCATGVWIIVFSDSWSVSIYLLECGCGASG